MKKESWKTIALALADRLSHARTPDCNPINPDCPFCRDHLVYARFTERLKQDGEYIPDPLAGFERISIEDIPVGSTMRLDGVDYDG